MTSYRMLIADTLADLTKENFEKFCHQLLDIPRAEGQPRIRRNMVQGKSYLEVTDALVSTFTDAGAVAVTTEILRRICCNQEAETLARHAEGAR